MRRILQVLSRSRQRLGSAMLVLATPCLFAFTLTDGAEEKAEFVESLRRDIVKIEHSIEVTKDLIKKSKTAKFLPDIIFRLAELYVEKSRLVYYLEVENKGTEAASSAEAKLLKNEAITIYNDVLKGFPDYRYADKVLFFLGHEYNELGMHEDMLATYRKLVDDYPKSNLLLESLFIIGDYYFNRDQLPDAEKYYNKVLKYRESPIHDMSRYKLGWVAINKAKAEDSKKSWKEALKFFEQVVLSKNEELEKSSSDPEGKSSSSNIKMQALDGVVFCYTEVYKPNIALDYFRKLATSKTIYLHSLEKLANRYFIKEQFDSAALMYRRIIELSNDVEKNLDFAQRIYDASSFSKKKDKVDEDVRALVKAAAKYAYSWRIPDDEKLKLAKEYEVYARDIVTKLHLLAQKRNEKSAYRIAAKAYDNYLSFFDYTDKIEEIRYNFAESLYHSEEYIEAAREYEKIARDMQESKNRKDALYSCIQSFQKALEEPKFLSRFELVESRQGMKQLGAFFVSRYPNDTKVPTIKFNVARMFYDQGEYKQAIESFNSFINQYPTHPEVKVAAHLVLDCFKQLEDYIGLAKQGRAFASNSAIQDQSLKREISGIVQQAEGRELDKKALEVAADGGDAVEELLKYAGTVSGGQAEEAIYRSFVLAKEKRNIDMAFKAGAQLAAQYEKSKHLEDIYATLGNFSAQMTDFERAAALYQDYFSRFPNDREAQQAMKAAASFKSYLGDYRGAIQTYKKLLNSGLDRGNILLEITDAYAKMDDWRMVLTAAKQAISEGRSAQAYLLLGRAQQKQGNISAAKNSFMSAASAGSSPSDNTYAAEAQFRLADMLLADYHKIRFGTGQDDVAVVQSKAQMVASIDQFYSGVIQMRDPKWAIAALFRLAEMYADFGNFLGNAPTPAGMNGAQQSQYRQMIGQQVKTQQQQSTTYIDTCRKTIRSKKVFGPYAMACLTGKLSASVDQTARSRTSRISDDEVKPLRAKLLKNPNDLDSLAEMARRAINAGDHHYARLVLSKGLEVNENHAVCLNLMGVVELNLGEDQTAYDYFRKAADSQGSFVPARLNMAGLFVKYQDEARAKAVLKSVVSQARTTDLSRADVHTVAKDALSQLRIR